MALGIALHAFPRARYLARGGSGGSAIVSVMIAPDLRGHGMQSGPIGCLRDGFAGSRCWPARHAARQKRRLSSAASMGGYVALAAWKLRLNGFWRWD